MRDEFDASDWQQYCPCLLYTSTPIALIQGYAEGLKEGINDDAESREFYCDVTVSYTHLLVQFTTF